MNQVKPHFKWLIGLAQVILEIIWITDSCLWLSHGVWMLALIVEGTIQTPVIQTGSYTKAFFPVI